MVDLRNIRVVALAEIAKQGDLLALLYALQVHVLLVDRLATLPRVPPVAGIKDIALLPDECPDGKAWIINGLLSQYAERPAFLVYGQGVSFAAWSGVVDSGGTDIITPPFSLDKLRAALQLAAEKHTDPALEQNDA